MHLEKLSLVNFKNYEEISLVLNPRINLFAGRNGSGKTNLLDAIYFLSFTKSAFLTSDVQAIRIGETYFMIKGNFKFDDSRDRELTASLQSGSKKIFREDQREYDKLSDHIGKFPAVLIAPDDTNLITGGSDVRRKFFDGIIAQIDKKYLDDLIQYNHVLKQRNSLLKMASENGKVDEIAMEVYDNLLVKFGEYLFRRREEFTAEFMPFFLNYFSMIVEEDERPMLSYVSGLKQTNFSEGLQKSRTKDVLLQRTNFGIHRDDFEFVLKDNEIKKTGSQGQQKSFVIALKLAQYGIIEKYKGFKPLLLLDDIFDKLDDYRIAALIKLLQNNRGQIFITDARPHRTSQLLDRIGGSTTSFIIEQGRIVKNDQL
jgi:DNA replication and repair protein RecF